MAANDPVGTVDKYIIQSKDDDGTEYTTTLSNKIQINPEATYQQIDTASRALNQLSTNNYYDTILVTNVSVTEQVAE